MIVLFIFLALVAMIFINVPIAVALAISGVIGIVAAEGAGALITIALDMYNGASKFSLIAIPMFVLAGAIMNASGITQRLIDFVSALIGFVRGGLAMVNVGDSRSGNFRIGCRRRRRARLGDDPADEKARLQRAVCGRTHVIFRVAGNHHTAVDPDDPVRRVLRRVDRAAIRGWRGTGHRRRCGYDAAVLVLRAALQPARRGRV
jgi:hypothetical protein